MAIESNIQAIITDLYPDATYMLASKFRANIDSFDVASTDLPLIILDNELTKNNSIAENGSINKDTRIVIYCLDQDSVENTDVQTNTIQQAMELIADRIALRIFRLANVFPVGSQKYKTTKLFHMFNTDLSGVALEMNVIENNLISCE